MRKPVEEKFGWSDCKNLVWSRKRRTENGIPSNKISSVQSRNIHQWLSFTYQEPPSWFRGGKFKRFTIGKSLHVGTWEIETCYFLLKSIAVCPVNSFGFNYQAYGSPGDKLFLSDRRSEIHHGSSVPPSWVLSPYTHYSCFVGSPDNAGK